MKSGPLWNLVEGIVIALMPAINRARGPKLQSRVLLISDVELSKILRKEKADKKAK